MIEYNCIIMSSPYDKILKRGEDKAKNKSANYKAHLHMISFDDSDDTSRADVPNIFLQEKEPTYDPYSPPLPHHPKPKKKKESHTGPVVQKVESSQQFQLSGQRSGQKRMVIGMEAQRQAEVQRQEIAQPQLDIHPHSSLSMLQIIKLNLGQFLFRNRYPIKKTIYINNNNEEQNQLNQKQFQLRNRHDRQLIHFNNSIQSGTFLFMLALLLRNLFGNLFIYAWLALIILQFIAEPLLLQMPMQYANDKASLIVLLLLMALVQTVADWLSFRKRTLWQQNTYIYRIYHHNGHMAEWVNAPATDIKAGNIYKLQPGEIFPTDCLLVYAQTCLITINQTAIVSQLVEHPSDITLKETVIRTDSMPLPISGCIVYQINAPEYTDFQVVGKLNLEEPNKQTYGVSMSNVVLRGCTNASQVEVVCMALETGIDSLQLKSLQYPYTQRQQHEYSSQYKHKKLSDKKSEEIQNYQNTFLGLNIQKKVESAVNVMILVYLGMVVFAVLVRFCYSLTTSSQFFMLQGDLAIWKVAIYHATNYLIFIPLTLTPMFKMYIVLAGVITQHNISNRELQMASGDRHRRADSLMESTSSKMEQLLDNKKIIFPLSIKDYNLVPELSKIDTIVTTIDTFRDHSAFTLHSLRFRQINHNFITNSLDNQAYSLADIQQMKYFMSVALLTSTKHQYIPDHDLPTSYDTCIQSSAKKYFDLQKKKNSRQQIRIGSQFAVKELFHIEPIYQYPYKVVFLEPIVAQPQPSDTYDLDQEDTDPLQRGKMASKENRNILVLIRGDPKTILDKCYGKSVQLTEQSRRLQDEKGFHVELLAKLTLHILDVKEIQKAYQSHNMDKQLFYKNLDKYISKVESMGLLVFVNQFHQKKIGESLKNPILNKSIINLSQPVREQLCDKLTSRMMPNMIILTPWSRSQQPQFQSIHTITNLLISPYLFNLSLGQVGDKIYHQRPADLDRMLGRLEEERVLVWNNWEQKDIMYTIEVMRQYGHNLMFYTEKDQFMYMMKQTNCSAKGGPHGYDSSKYSDINLTSRSSISYLYLLQLIKYDSILVRQGAISILLTQIGKFVFYVLVQAIQLFYTRGTGLIVFKTPLFFVVEIVIFLDVLYYLNWKDTGRAYTFHNKRGYLREVGLKVLEKALQGFLITFIAIYSTQTPCSSDATPHSYHYTYFTIVFIVLHVLVLEKLFSLWIQAFSIYKGVILGIQMLMIYVGLVVVSALDKYHYKGILWATLKAGNIWVTIIGLTWISLTLPGIRWLSNILRHRGLRTQSKKLL